MNQAGYGAYIAEAVAQIPYGDVFEAAEVAHKLSLQFRLPVEQAKTVTNNKLKRMADSRQLERLQKGQYYRTKETAFGKIPPRVNDFTMRQLIGSGPEICGYESGASFMNQLGLTTLMPRDREIVTNHYRRRLPPDLHVSLKKPADTITTANVRYLQMLDMIDRLPTAHVDAPNPDEILRGYAGKNDVDPLTLIRMARRLYSQRTVLRVIDLFMEGA